MSPFRLLTAASLVATMAMTSCATVFNRPVQPVKVTSEPSGMSFTVKTPDGEVVGQGVTPGEVRLKTSSAYFRPATYQFEFRRGGKLIGTRTLTGELSGWYVGNVLIGGLIGMIVIDPLSGAMFTLPNDVHQSGAPLASIEMTEGRSLAVVSIDTLSSDERARLVRL